MLKFRVMICGRNFLMHVDGKKRRMGFFTHVFVEARDAGEAENRAVQILREDSDLRLLPMNLKMPSLISNDLRILRFMGAMRVQEFGEVSF